MHQKCPFSASLEWCNERRNFFLNSILINLGVTTTIHRKNSLQTRKKGIKLLAFGALIHDKGETSETEKIKYSTVHLFFFCKWTHRWVEKSYHLSNSHQAQDGFFTNWIIINIRCFIHRITKDGLVTIGKHRLSKFPYIACVGVCLHVCFFRRAVKIQFSAKGCCSPYRLVARQIEKHIVKIVWACQKRIKERTKKRQKVLYKRI